MLLETSKVGSGLATGFISNRKHINLHWQGYPLEEFHLMTDGLSTEKAMDKSILTHLSTKQAMKSTQVPGSGEERLCYLSWESTKIWATWFIFNICRYFWKWLKVNAMSYISRDINRIKKTLYIPYRSPLFLTGDLRFSRKFITSKVIINIRISANSCLSEKRIGKLEQQKCFPPQKPWSN